MEHLLIKFGTEVFDLLFLTLQKTLSLAEMKISYKLEICPSLMDTDKVWHTFAVDLLTFRIHLRQLFFIKWSLQALSNCDPSFPDTKMQKTSTIYGILTSLYCPHSEGRVSRSSTTLVAYMSYECSQVGKSYGVSLTVITSITLVT